ncbi:MAG: PD40 domain-containing protein, partial [Acidobacteria bacterium]|nr:PD40 domain-containing protein [Acidobacteriota bacterium]
MSVRRLVVAACLLFALAAVPSAPVGAAGSGTRMLRSPSVSATAIAFAYANNIWTVDRAGGTARRLTTFQGATGFPRFSPDGKWIAFSAEYGGNSDVYVIPAEGGEPKQLTWHPGADTVQGWTPDGKSVMFASTRATWAPSGAARFWTVPAAGGPEEPLPLPRGYQGKLSPDGRHIAYRMNSSWDEERRNYRGGQNRPIWIVDMKTYDLVSPPWTDSKDMDPVWVGDTVFFLSDRDGVSNVWAYEYTSKRLRQMTKFTDYDVKSLDAGAGVVVFEQGGYIHEMDPASGRDKLLTINAVGDFPWMMPRWEDVSSRIALIKLSATGKRALVEARGEVFSIPVEKGDVRNLTHSSGSAERDPAWSPDGQFVSYFSDKSGEYTLIIESQDGMSPPREIALPKPTHYYTASWSPDSKKIVYTDTNLNVWVMDVASGQAKIVGRDPWMVPQRTVNPVWSPDSKWVAYVAHLQSLHRAIYVSNVETGESKQLTDGLSDAVSPAWDASGKYLWFMASTDFGLASQWLDMTSYDHTETFGVYFAVLKKGEPTPLIPESDEEAVPAAPTADRESAAGRPAGGARPVVSVQIDFDGIQRRVISVPGIPARAYANLKSGVAGTIYYLEAGTLRRYRLTERRAADFI